MVIFTIMKFLRPIQLLALVASLFMLAGCLTEDPMIVNDSQLNWMSIKYRPLPDSPYKPCSIDIFGTGLIRYNEGHSPLVANDFAVNVEDKHWGEHFRDEIGSTPAEAQQLLQAFVDAGVMTQDKDKKRSEAGLDMTTTNGIVIYRAKINGEAGACVSDSPKLIAPVERLVDIIHHGRSDF